MRQKQHMLKIGVLGAGHLGKIHLKLLKELAQWQLFGFYDISEQTRTQVSADMQIKAFDNELDLIKQVDAVAIITPTVSHFEMAALAIKAGKHVFIEKPITETVAQAKQLLQLAKEAKVHIQVGHVERFNPAFDAALPYLTSPMFIEAHRLAEFNPRGTDVSVVLDLMIHDIDVILSVVKSNIKKISASSVAVVSDTPDICNARIAFENGCVANLTASRISLKNMRKHRFFQKDAYIAVDFYKKRTEVVRLKKIEGEADPLAIVIDLGKDKGQKQIFFEVPEVAESNAIKAELMEFYSTVANGKKPRVSGYDAYNALDVAYQIIEKATIQDLVE